MRIQSIICLPFILFGAILSGCASGAGVASDEAISEETTSTEQAWNVDSTFVFYTNGHETLLWGALAILAEQGYSYPTFLAETCTSVVSTSSMLRGNCATDMPDSTIRTFLGISATANWHTSPTIQDIHWLRNYNASNSTGVVGAWRSCTHSRDRVVNATKAALYHAAQGNLDAAYYYLGHATHVIQDSFSPAHTTRTDDSLNLLDDCSYGRQVSDACYHSHPALEFADEDSITAYQPLATAATNSTVGYLRAVHWWLYNYPYECGNIADEYCESRARQILAPFFEGDPGTIGTETGMHSCAYLPNKPAISWSWVDNPWAARDIAGCSTAANTVYALNYDGAIYKGNLTSSGWGGWSHVTTYGYIRSIACVGATLYGLDYWGQLWKWSTSAWANVDADPGVTQIAGAADRMYYLYTDTNPPYVGFRKIPIDSTTYPFWLGTYASPTSIAGVRLSTDVAFTGYKSYMVMLGGGAISINTAQGRNGYWQTIEAPSDALEISGGTSNRIWKLTNSYQLYVGTITE